MLVWLPRKKCASVEKKYSAGSHVFDHMTLNFPYKPINYGVGCSLYGVACSVTVSSIGASACNNLNTSICIIRPWAVIHGHHLHKVALYFLCKMSEKKISRMML